MSQLISSSHISYSYVHNLLSPLPCYQILGDGAPEKPYNVSVEKTLWRKWAFWRQKLDKNQCVFFTLVPWGQIISFVANAIFITLSDICSTPKVFVIGPKGGYYSQYFEHGTIGRKRPSYCIST
jgi:hypothetical protein